MSKAVKKPIEIDYISFDEFVKHGINYINDHPENGNIVDGVPWSFKYNGHPITHENNECYLIPTLEGFHNFTPKDVLITGVKGEIYPCKIDIFDMTYDRIN